jgi:hypothetical protein
MKQNTNKKEKENMIKILDIPMSRRDAEQMVRTSVDDQYITGAISNLTDRQLQNLLTKYAGTK